MFKVTSRQQAGMGSTLRLEGRLTGAWVHEFEKELANAMKRSAKVTLNLDGLLFADDHGVAVIRLAIERGAHCAGGSEFIGALIHEERSQ